MPPGPAVRSDRPELPGASGLIGKDTGERFEFRLTVAGWQFDLAYFAAGRKFSIAQTSDLSPLLV